MSYSVGWSRGLDPTLLCLCCSPKDVALIWPLAWKRPYATDTALKKKFFFFNLKKEKVGVLVVVQWKQIWLGTMRLPVESLASLSGLRIGLRTMSCGVGCRCGLDPALPWLWLWHRLAAIVPIWPVAWEAPYAAGVALKSKKKKKRRKYLLKSQFYKLCFSKLLFKSTWWALFWKWTFLWCRQLFFMCQVSLNWHTSVSVGTYKPKAIVK